MDNLLIRCSSLGKIMTEPRDKAAGLSATTITYLRELARGNAWGRNSFMANKFTEKGVSKEEDSITLYSLVKKVNFKKNSTRLNNTFITGEPDLFEGETINNADTIIDIKSSWDWCTFPFPDDAVDKTYYWQGQGYMALTGAKEFKLVHCLVNSPEHLIKKRQQDIYYLMGCPDDSNERYLAAMIEVEKNMIYDRKQFFNDYPNYDFFCQDWSFDIPREERVREVVILRNGEDIQKAFAKIEKCRKYISENLITHKIAA